MTDMTAVMAAMTAVIVWMPAAMALNAALTVAE
jgi:hypothetical protein